MLEITDLSHRFGNLLAVDQLSMTVSAGNIVGFVGRNGAGKTTTMRAIMGVLVPYRGALRWENHDIGSADRLRFGYMPEERGLYPQMPLLEQVAYFARLHGMARRDAVEAGKSWLTRLGLSDRFLDQVVSLSHGNQQRAQLAVAIVHKPDLLALDEPFAGLDPAAVDVLSGVLRAEAQRGAAILFSSHQLDLVERLCDRTVIIDQGRVLAAGTLAELRARVPQYLRVEVSGGGAWAAGLTGSRIVEQNAESVLLSLDEGTDPQTVLKAAMAAGTVEHFGFESGGLVQLYRELVPG